MQKIAIPILGVAISTQNTDKCLAAFQAPTTQSVSFAEISVTVEGVLNTDTILMRYALARTTGAGTPGTSVTPYQINRTNTLPTNLASAGYGPFSSEPTASEKVWNAAVIPQREMFRVFNQGEIACKESEYYALFVNILGTTNTNLKFTGHIWLWI